MMPMTRAQIEVLLDRPDRQAFVVSAYADMTVKDGFSRHIDQAMQNKVRDAREALSEAEARKELEVNLEVVREAVTANPEPSARGLAVFANVATGMRHVVPLNFRVENKIVVDEEPHVLPLLEQWYGAPEFLVAVVDSNHVHCFNTRNGEPEAIETQTRPDADEAFQRDKPRFADKHRFRGIRHERLSGHGDSDFLKDMAAHVGRHWSEGEYAGLLVLGQPELTRPFREMLPKDAAAAVVETARQPMTAKPEDVADDVRRAMDGWRSARESALMAELQQRWKEDHLVGNGPTDVLDALQQGRAVEVAVGPSRDIPGAQCQSCGYRFGAPVATCVYCQGRCRNVNAVQEILRLAMKQRLPVYLYPADRPEDPLSKAGGVCALLRAEANWAPDSATAAATRGNG